ncbi:hypothetical protein MKW92_017472 [Papaver armeniacum]|nr:hypothetical protein MKW92_017472 [Papaver armeniacum]
MSTRNDHHQMVPLGVLLKRELDNEKIENPDIIHGEFNQSKKGEDFTFSKRNAKGSLEMGLFDGHNGSGAAIYSKENLLNNIVGAIPSDLSREEWVAALPRAMVAGFVKTDKDFQERAKTSGTTCTFVIIDGWIVTVASVGDSCCVFESAEGDVYNLSADHRLETNEEERERITASGGEVGRLNAGGGAEIGPLRCWPGGLCLSRSIGDMDLSSAGGRLVISSDGVWDALSTEVVLNCCRGMTPEAAAAQIVKEAVGLKGLRDDTTCIVVDLLPPEKSTPPQPQQKKQAKGVFKSMFRKKACDSSSYLDKDYAEPDVVEELFEEGSAYLSERLETEYPLCNLFKLFRFGISIHSGSENPGTSRPWDGPFLCSACQIKKEAMEGKRASGNRRRDDSDSD